MFDLKKPRRIVSIFIKVSEVRGSFPKLSLKILVNVLVIIWHDA